MLTSISNRCKLKMECEVFMGYLSIALGVYFLFCILFKPKFFWESKKAIRLRNSIGDSKAALVYYIIVAVALGIGVLSMFGIVNFD